MEKNTARFDTRLSQEQKEFFEYAADLGGYRTLTEFVINALQKEAQEIVKKHRTILSSQQDQAIFFDAIMNPAAPGSKLKSAAKKYNKQLK